MPTSHSSGYRFDSFLEEARNLIEKSRAAVYFHLIFPTKRLWDELDELMDAYSEDGRRNWRVSLSRTQQEDFYILQFISKEDESERHSFFWKVIAEKDEIIILSFSLEKFQFVRSCLMTFARFSNMDLPWLGSTFLENLDTFVRTTFGADNRLDYRWILYDLQPLGGKGKAQTNLMYTGVTSKDDIIKKHMDAYKTSSRFFYIRRMKVSVSGRRRFVFSISDEGEILFEKGDLFMLLEMVNSLRNIVSFYRSSARKRLDMEVREAYPKEGKKTELRTIQMLEVLKLDVKKPMTRDWYDNFESLFSTPYRREEKLMSFVLMKGNPYFLAQVIDLEKGGSGIYLSATEDSIRLSPSSKATSISTVFKIIEALQKYVDPSITIAGA